MNAALGGKLLPPLNHDFLPNSFHLRLIVQTFIYASMKGCPDAMDLYSQGIRGQFVPARQFSSIVDFWLFLLIIKQNQVAVSR
jgi:hypothetical protein